MLNCSRGDGWIVFDDPSNFLKTNQAQNWVELSLIAKSQSVIQSPGLVVASDARYLYLAFS